MVRNEERTLASAKVLLERAIKSKRGKKKASEVSAYWVTFTSFMISPGAKKKRTRVVQDEKRARMEVDLARE